MIKEDLFYRINDLIPRDKSRPRILPFSRSTFWLGIQQGRFPKPTKFGPRVSAWKGSQINELLRSGTEG